MSHAGNSGHLTRVRHSSHKSITTSMCCIFMCQFYGSQCLGILTCIEVLMHVHGGCTDTVRKSPLKVDWEKNCLPYTGLEPLSVLCLAFQSDALPTKLSSPLFHCYRKKIVLFCPPCLSVWKGVIVCLVFTSIICFCPVLERCCPPPPNSTHTHTHAPLHTHTHTHTTQ